MNDGMSEEKSFSDLYGYFCGMVTRGKMDDLCGQIMGLIPDLGFVKGKIKLGDQIGLKINHK